MNDSTGGAPYWCRRRSCLVSGRALGREVPDNLRRSEDEAAIPWGEGASWQSSNVLRTRISNADKHADKRGTKTGQGRER